jgi:peroxiredoxin (alkyl hydroperoxide reductase subunit C)
MSTLVRSPAPAFTAKAIMGNDVINEAFSLDLYRDRFVLLFFYPLDFTFVCPSEILAFDQCLTEFFDLDCEVVGVSVDSHHAHLAWKHTPLDRGGIGPVRFPLVSDLDKSIARKYAVLSDESVALRATFLIDPERIVRHMAVNDLDLGRGIPEILRILKALRHTRRTEEVCPANWEPGMAAMTPNREGVARYLRDARS